MSSTPPQDETPVSETTATPDSSPPVTSDIQPPLEKLWLWWVVFLTATVLLSWVLQTFRDFTVAPTWTNGSLFALSVVAMVVSLILLTYDSYVKEKRKDNVHRTIGLFEWMLVRQQQWMSRRRNSHR